MSEAPDARDALAIANAVQHGFPLVARPYAALAGRFGTAEAAVIAAFAALRESRVLARVGATFRPNTVGASMLAAMAVPPHALEAVAALVSHVPGVNHNYARAHDVNLWFVIAAPEPAALEASVRAIEADTGHAVLRLPLRAQYNIDLGFDLGSDPTAGRSGARRTAPAPAPVVLDSVDRALVDVLGAGLSLVERPFAVLAAAAGTTEEDALARIGGWCASGVIQRFGAILRHHELGYTANAMCVWTVPAADADRIGPKLATMPGITLCYRRAPATGARPWPHTLYCMIHGRDRARVLEQRAEAVRRCGLAGYPDDVLFSVRRYKQAAAHFALDRAAADAPVTHALR